MPEMPDFNVPFLGKPLSQVKQETWERLQEEKHQRQLVLVTVSIGKGQEDKINSTRLTFLLHIINCHLKVIWSFNQVT